MKQQHYSNQKNHKPDKLLIAALVFTALAAVLVGVVAFQTRTFGKPQEETTEVAGQLSQSSASGWAESEDAAQMDAAFANRLTELAAEYGVFVQQQTGVINKTQNQWFAPIGLMGAAIRDLDADGEPELLVSIAQPCEHSLDGVCHILLQVYEKGNGETFLADQALFGTYIQDPETETEVKEVWFQAGYGCDEIAAINLMQVNENNLIVCEDYYVSRAYGDGMFQSYWVMEYKDHELCYVCAFTQTEGGSSDFAFTGYKFEDGACVSSDLYYNQYYYADPGSSEPPLYDDFGQAIHAFFEGYGIQLNEQVQSVAHNEEDFASFLSPEEESETLFELTNRLTARNNEYTQYEQYEFAANLRSGNDLLQQADIAYPDGPTVPPLLEGSRLIAVGTLTERDYEINSNNKGTVLILELDEPMTKALYSEWWDYAGELQEITEIQVDISEWERNPPVVGQHVALNGEVMYQHTGHHLTMVLLMDASVWN